MAEDNENRRLIEQVERQATRLRRARRERDSLLAGAGYIGVLGLVLVLPVVAGAYLGVWLDNLSPGYSVRWTLGCILLGLVIGVMNVWYLQRGGGDGG